MSKLAEIQRDAREWHATKRRYRHNIDLFWIGAATITTGALGLMTGPIGVGVIGLLGLKEWLGKRTQYTIGEGMYEIEKTKDAEKAAAILKGMKEQFDAFEKLKGKF